DRRRNSGKGNHRRRQAGGGRCRCFVALREMLSRWWTEHQTENGRRSSNEVRFEENQRGRDNEMENSKLPARFAARCRSYRRSRPSLRRRENSGNESQPVHAFERG